MFSSAQPGDYGGQGEGAGRLHRCHERPEGGHQLVRLLRSKDFFYGTSIFKILFAGHSSTTQTAQLVLKQQGKSFQISRHTLLRMTGASATLRLR